MTGQLFTVPVQGTDSDERFTPSWVFDGLGLTFDTDPASPVGGGDVVPARTKFTRNDDGLAQDWHGLVWLNPPFSESTPWADKFRAHGSGVFLGPIANSRWTFELMQDANAVWLCRDFAFTHPTHAGKRSAMPLFFAAYGPEATAGLERLATTSGHPGVLRHAPDNGRVSECACNCVVNHPDTVDQCSGCNDHDGLCGFCLGAGNGRSDDQ